MLLQASSVQVDYPRLGMVDIEDVPTLGLRCARFLFSLLGRIESVVAGWEFSWTVDLHNSACGSSSAPSSAAVCTITGHPVKRMQNCRILSPGSQQNNIIVSCPPDCQCATSSWAYSDVLGSSLPILIHCPKKRRQSHRNRDPDCCCGTKHRQAQPAHPALISIFGSVWV